MHQMCKGLNDGDDTLPRTGASPIMTDARAARTCCDASVDSSCVDSREKREGHTKRNMTKSSLITIAKRCSMQLWNPPPMFFQGRSGSQERF